jgi:NADPH:quinone reductase-like Zn-dependent oxidoreductase
MLRLHQAHFWPAIWMELELSSDFSKSLWIERPCEAAVRKSPLSPVKAGECRVRTLWSGISRGTERLVFEGRVPESEHETMRCPAQEGDFPFPVKYGYANVGLVEQGPEPLEGRVVFSLFPHQTCFNAPAERLHPLPDGLPPRRAVLAANTETALNAVWDSGAAPGDRIHVVGAGAVGLLVTSILSAIPGCRVTVSDPDETRADTIAGLGGWLAGPDTLPDDHDVVFHTSASPQGLATAIASAGVEATIVEMSWYGAGDVPAPLGGAFHSRRLKLVSSQVGRIPAARSPRWDYRRRLATALDLLCRDDRLDRLITAETPFSTLPDRLPEILAPGASGIVTAISYD